MKIFICCSKYIYDQIPAIRKKLENADHIVTLPNSYEDPFKEERLKKESRDMHKKWKAEMFSAQAEKVKNSDAILVLNFKKNDQPNYIGGATFLEIFKAFELGKKIFLYNPIPHGILCDEIMGFDPIILNGDLSLVK